MARALRESPELFLSSRANGRRNIDHSDADRRMFLEQLASAARRFGWLVTAWVLMSNHFYLVLETSSANLSQGKLRCEALTSTFRVHSFVMAVFAEIFKRLRQEKNLSQQELADVIVDHVLQISKYEMGTSLLTLEGIRHMADVLDISADELVFGSSKRRKGGESIKNAVLAERLRRPEEIVRRDEPRSVIDLLDAFIAKGRPLRSPSSDRNICEGVACV